jgi:hypothetical protein
MAFRGLIGRPFPEPDRLASGLLLPSSLVEGSAMFASLREKLRKNGTEILFYLGTHGITVLLMMVAAALQRGARQFAHHLLVIDHQNSRGLAIPPP